MTPLDGCNMVEYGVVYGMYHGHWKCSRSFGAIVYTNGRTQDKERHTELAFKCASKNSSCESLEGMHISFPLISILAADAGEKGGRSCA